MAVKGKFGGDADAGMNGEHSSMTGLLMEPVVRIVITRKCCRVSTISHHGILNLQMSGTKPEMAAKSLLTMFMDPINMHGGHARLGMIIRER